MLIFSIFNSIQGIQYRRKMRKTLDRDPFKNAFDMKYVQRFFALNTAFVHKARGTPVEQSIFCSLCHVINEIYR